MVRRERSRSAEKFRKPASWVRRSWEGDVFADGHFEDQAVLLAVFGDKGDAGGDRVPGELVLIAWPLTRVIPLPLA